MYDVTDRKSFDHALNTVKVVPSNVIAILIGNKIDLPNREVNSGVARANVKLFGAKHFEMSAKTGEGIFEPLLYAIRASLKTVAT